MNSYDIYEVLRNRVGRNILFRGVLASDQVKSFEIPNMRDKDIAFIANILRLGDKRMGHWVVFLITKSPTKEIYFFDSYGLSPVFYSNDFAEFLKCNKEFELYAIKRKLQSDTSLVCGLYASWYIYHCSRYSLSRVMHILKKNFPTDNGKHNDKAVFNFYIKKLNRKKCSYWRNIDKSLVTYVQCRSSL